MTHEDFQRLTGHRVPVLIAATRPGRRRLTIPPVDLTAFLARPGRTVLVPRGSEARGPVQFSKVSEESAPPDPGFLQPPPVAGPRF
jgi:hypothetical protein